MNYTDASAKLGKRASKKLANNTYLKRLDDSTIGLLLHETYIAKYTPEYIELDNGGYFTNVTKARLNAFTPASISQKNSLWYFADGSIFHANCIIDFDGLPIIPIKPDAAEKQTRALKKRINTYATNFVKYIDSGKLDAPSSGDCWFCAMFDKDGQGDTAHLIEHMKQSYFVPSLLVNAIKHAKYGNVPFIFSEMARGDFYATKSILTKYLYKRLRNV